MWIRIFFGGVFAQPSFPLPDLSEHILSWCHNHASPLASFLLLAANKNTLKRDFPSPPLPILAAIGARGMQLESPFHTARTFLVQLGRDFLVPHPTMAPAAHTPWLPSSPGAPRLEVKRNYDFVLGSCRAMASEETWKG